MIGKTADDESLVLVVIVVVFTDGEWALEINKWLMVDRDQWFMVSPGCVVAAVVNNRW